MWALSQPFCRSLNLINTLNMQFHTKAWNINSKFALSSVGTIRIIGILVRTSVRSCTHTFRRRFFYFLSTGKASILKKFGRDNVFQEWNYSKIKQQLQRRLKKLTCNSKRTFFLFTISCPNFRSLPYLVLEISVSSYYTIANIYCHLGIFLDIPTLS